MITDTFPIAVQVGLVGSPGKMKRWRRNRKCHDRDAKYKNRRDYKNNIFTDEREQRVDSGSSHLPLDVIQKIYRGSGSV